MVLPLRQHAAAAVAESTLPTVACVIPTHRRPGHLRAALASVLAQDHAVEVVVVDDADDPGTRAVVEECGPDRVAYLVNPGAGASSSRNLGVRETSTEVVALLDDDDEWDPRYVSTALAVMTGRRVNAVFTQIARSAVLPARLDVRSVVAHNPGVTGSNIVIRREAFERVGGFDESLWVSNDKDFLVRFLDCELTYAVVTEPLVHYWHDASDRLTEPSPQRLRALQLYYTRYRDRMRPAQRLFVLGVVHSTAARLSPRLSGRIGHRAACLLLFACSPRAAVTRVTSRRVRTRAGGEPGRPPGNLPRGRPDGLARPTDLRQDRGQASLPPLAGRGREQQRTA